MQQAIPFRPWMLDPAPAREINADRESRSGCSTSERVRSLAAENAVLVLGRRGCCMCHVVKRLLLGLGVNPLVFEVDGEKEIVDIAGTEANLQFPAVFIGGQLVGGLEWLMATHISGDLVPILKKAGALWL